MMTLTMFEEPPTDVSGEWHVDAACRGVDLNDDVSGIVSEWYTPDQTNWLRDLCDSCPVRLTCREYAYQTNQQVGVWGGLVGEDELRRYRRNRLRESRIQRGRSR